ncbi:MAG: hypothetical protein KKA07_02505 [Bacteroidetes bacterium]|nr:hypothetical protein [Bacteroidota bacterium]MBU1717921.1 hypothetical protein [Bacteroidota bacterium]
MRNATQTIICFFSLFLAISSFSQKLPEWDPVFPASNLDTFQIYPGMKTGAINLLPFFSGDPSSFCGEFESPQGNQVRILPVAKLDMDTIHKMRAYVVQRKESGYELYMIWLFDLSKGKCKESIEITAKKVIPSTAEFHGNAWICDFDNDGLKDIFLVNETIDYEYPTESAPNISGTESYLILLKKDSLVWTTQPSIYEHLTLKK